MAVEMRVTLRLPLAVHTALTREAKSSKLSLNQLIVDRLNASLGNPYRGGVDADVADRVDRLESELERLRAEVQQLPSKK